MFPNDILTSYLFLILHNLHTYWLLKTFEPGDVHGVMTLVMCNHSSSPCLWLLAALLTWLGVRSHALSVAGNHLWAIICRKNPENAFSGVIGIPARSERSRALWRHGYSEQEATDGGGRSVFSFLPPPLFKLSTAVPGHRRVASDIQPGIAVSALPLSNLPQEGAAATSNLHRS